MADIKEEKNSKGHLVLLSFVRVKKEHLRATQCGIVICDLHFLLLNEVSSIAVREFPFAIFCLEM